MDKIFVSKVPKHETRSCNICDARNYHSTFCNLGGYTEDLYNIRIGYIVICLCRECSVKLAKNITEFIQKGGVDE
jgi:hypothetical protein